MTNQVMIRDVKDKPVLLYKDGKKIGEILTELSLNDVRLQVKENKLKGYYLVFEGQKIEMYSTGNVASWPDGLMDTNENQLKQLLYA